MPISWARRSAMVPGMVWRRPGPRRTAARSTLTALATALGLVLSGCQVLGVGSGSDVSENFEGEGVQVLAQAVADGKGSVIRDLVDGGASLGTTGNDGVTMLQLAIYEKKQASFRTLLDLGADPEQAGYRGDTALHTAAKAASPDYLRWLLEAGVDPDVRNTTTQRTPLMESAAPGLTDQLEMLLDAGADVTLADRSGSTALHRAAITNAIFHVRPLLEAGADPLATVDTGATFQDYLYHGSADILLDDALRELGRIADWLTAHDVPLHEDVPWP